MPILFKLNVASSKVDFMAQGLSARIQDWRETWPNVSAQLALVLAGQFEQEGGRGGHGRWAPLSAAYARRKARDYPGKGILQASGRLRQSLAERSFDAVEIREPLRMRFGTRASYAVYHQSGTRKMPARRMFDLNERDRLAICQTFQRAAVNFSRLLGFGVASDLGVEDAAFARRSKPAMLAEAVGALREAPLR